MKLLHTKSSALVIAVIIMLFVDVMFSLKAIFGQFSIVVYQ